MSRDSMRGFAAGLLFAALVIGGYYYLEAKQAQEVTFETLEQAAKDRGYELVSKEAATKETTATEGSINKTTETSEISQAQNFQLQITNGMGSDDIAQILFETDIIESVDQFETYLKDNDLTKKIQIGVFQLTEGMSFEEISTIITNLP